MQMTASCSIQTHQNKLLATRRLPLYTRLNFWGVEHWQQMAKGHHVSNINMLDIYLLILLTILNVHKFLGFKQSIPGYSFPPTRPGNEVILIAAVRKQWTSNLSTY